MKQAQTIKHATLNRICKTKLNLYDMQQTQNNLVKKKKKKNKRRRISSRRCINTLGLTSILGPNLSLPKELNASTKDMEIQSKEIKNVSERQEGNAKLTCEV